MRPRLKWCMRAERCKSMPGAGRCQLTHMLHLPVWAEHGVDAVVACALQGGAVVTVSMESHGMLSSGALRTSTPCGEGMRVHRAALTNSASVNRLVASAVDGSVLMSCREPALWQGVAHAIQLTPAQRADIVQLWRLSRWRFTHMRLVI